MVEFSLPALSQDQFSSFYGKSVPQTNEKIIYPGIKLPCSSKSRSLKRVIRPQHVFITKVGDKFTHRLLGNDNHWSILPKRMHSVCFPKIHLASIPKQNRIEIQLTDNIFETLPYVPDEFYKQKLAKAERPAKPITRRNKRRRTEMAKNIDKGSQYTGWEIQGIEKDLEISKKTLIKRIRTCIQHIDNDNLFTKNPFSTDTDEAKHAFVSVVQFIHHYAREEFNMQTKEPDDNTLWDRIKNSI